MVLRRCEMATKEIIENELGIRFNRANKISCPFHKDNTPSLSYNLKNDKWHCFSCGRGGDGIDFIKEYKGLNYIQTCNYLNIPLNAEYEAVQRDIDRIEDRIKWQIANIDSFKDWKLIKIYRFTDSEGKTLYFKAKFSTLEKKQIRYYSITKENKIEMKRNCEEVPYNYSNVAKNLYKNKSIYIVEGEKDVDTMSYLGFVATSFKGIKDFDYSIFEGAKIYFIGDTGEAGEKYKKEIWIKLKDFCKEFNIVDLPGIQQLGNNADLTDWLEAGHSKEELLSAINDVWDWKKSVFWKYVKIKKDGTPIPVRVWQNLDILLNRKGVILKYNVISKEIETSGSLNSVRNNMLTDIYSLNILENLNMSREEVKNSISKIAENNKYNPFVEFLERNKNVDFDIIDKVFNCLILNLEEFQKRDYYYNLFLKWCINVVRMSHNTLENGYGSQGVLVLQGVQGARKSTFFKVLLPYNNWFKGEKVLDPSNKDSVRENTKYIVVELGELDATMKSDQAKLKAFITTESDEYRSPYAAYEERYPRLTSFCATVNKKDFLKDETGSRRWWIIPIQRCDIETLNKLDINKFWGAVYTLWKNNEIPYYLTAEETEKLSGCNTQFAVENDISLVLDEGLDWSQEEEEWRIYGLIDLCNKLDIKEKKALKNELERRGFTYKKRRDRYNVNSKWGFLLPKLTTQAENKYMNKYMR